MTQHQCIESIISIFISKRIHIDNYAIVIKPEIMDYLGNVNYYEIKPGNLKTLCLLVPHKTKVKNSYKLQRRKGSKSGVIEFACELTKQNKVGFVGKKCYTDIIFDPRNQIILIKKPDTKIKTIKNTSTINLEQKLSNLLEKFSKDLFNLLSKEK